MLRVELTKHVLRIRTALALLMLAAVPIIAGLATASDAGGPNGTQDGLYGAAPFSALNHAAASLEFTAPLLLALGVALLGSMLGASDRAWGTLRYLYVRPVGVRRLLLAKWGALAVWCALATACVTAAGLIVGVIVFGWHPFHRIDAAPLSVGAAAARLLAASAYVAVCMASIGTIALGLGLLLPGPGEALGASVAFVVVAQIIDGQGSLSPISTLLPVHYWQRWTHLLEGGTAGLPLGLVVQAIWITAIGIGASALVARRNPAA
jgi:ABC-2 type transport system permease protein